MEENQENIVKDLTQTEKKSVVKEIILPALIILVIILAGSATGYFLANRDEGGLTGQGSVANGVKEVGIKDEKQFPDKAEGKLQVNEDTNIPEGSHKLIRPGGASQTVYLTSSVVDLNQFVGKCVQVWGETFAAQKAGWLMDAGLVKTLSSCPSGI